MPVSGTPVTIDDGESLARAAQLAEDAALVTGDAGLLVSEQIKADEESALRYAAGEIDEEVLESLPLRYAAGDIDEKVLVSLQQLSPSRKKGKKNRNAGTPLSLTVKNAVLTAQLAAERREVETAQQKLEEGRDAFGQKIKKTRAEVAKAIKDLEESEDLATREAALDAGVKVAAGAAELEAKVTEVETLRRELESATAQLKERDTSLALTAAEKTATEEALSAANRAVAEKDVVVAVARKTISELEKKAKAKAEEQEAELAALRAEVADWRKKEAFRLRRRERGALVSKHQALLAQQAKSD